MVLPSAGASISRQTSGYPRQQFFDALTLGRNRVARSPASLRSKATRNGVSVDDVEDPFISRVLHNCLTSDMEPVELRRNCLRALSKMRMPTRRQEEYKFTDITPILQSELKQTTFDLKPEAADAIGLDSAADNRLVMVNGRIQWDRSQLQSDLKDAVFDASRDPDLGARSVKGGTFAMLNGAVFMVALGIEIPEGIKIDRPLHLVYLSAGEDDVIGISAPRLLIKCRSRSSLQIVEEFMTPGGVSSSHLSIPVCEIHLEDGAELSHHYAQLDGPSAFHMKTTVVRQERQSKYTLIESSVGASLSRHDLIIDQEGAETETEMRHFYLSGEHQLHDLHSKVTLDYEDGIVNQLHKCIVTSASASGIFDGNVKVNRQAQRTDAGQLTRNLLLAPKATVNAKPNLQIIADDVKCTHGCTVSDLSAEELFYFTARGIDYETARRALVYSFGSEITSRLTSTSLQERVGAAVLDRLSNV